MMGYGGGAVRRLLKMTQKQLVMRGKDYHPISTGIYVRCISCFLVRKMGLNEPPIDRRNDRLSIDMMSKSFRN
jgi:hypothetical protein